MKRRWLWLLCAKAQEASRVLKATPSFVPTGFKLIEIAHEFKHSSFGDYT